MAGKNFDLVQNQNFNDVIIDENAFKQFGFENIASIGLYGLILFYLQNFAF